MNDTTPTTNSAFIVLTADGAQALLTLAPALLLSSVLRTPRTALYIKSETLLLLTLVYAFNYSHIFFEPLSLDSIPQYAHLLLLSLATLSVYRNQRRAFLPSLPSAEEEKPLDPLPAASLATKRNADFEQLIQFDRRLFSRVLFWSCLPAVYSGPHSLLARLLDAYNHTPSPPLGEAVTVQMCIATTLLEINAMVLLFARVLFQRRAAVHAPPPTEAQLEAAKVDEAEWKLRLRTPGGVWAFMCASVASAALQIPALVQDVSDAGGRLGGKGSVEAELPMWRAVGCGMLVVMFAMTLVFYRSMRPGRIQLSTDEEEQDKADDSA